MTDFFSSLDGFIQKKRKLQIDKPRIYNDSLEATEIYKRYKEKSGKNINNNQSGPSKLSFYDKLLEIHEKYNAYFTQENKENIFNEYLDLISDNMTNSTGTETRFCSNLKYTFRFPELEQIFKATINNSNYDTIDILKPNKGITYFLKKYKSKHDNHIYTSFAIALFSYKDFEPILFECLISASIIEKIESTNNYYAQKAKKSELSLQKTYSNNTTSSNNDLTVMHPRYNPHGYTSDVKNINYIHLVEELLIAYKKFNLKEKTYDTFIPLSIDIRTGIGIYLVGKSHMPPNIRVYERQYLFILIISYSRKKPISRGRLPQILPGVFTSENYENNETYRVFYPDVLYPLFSENNMVLDSFEDYSEAVQEATLYLKKKCNNYSLESYPSNFKYYFTTTTKRSPEILRSYDSMTKEQITRVDNDLAEHT